MRIDHRAVMPEALEAMPAVQRAVVMEATSEQAAQEQAVTDELVEAAEAGLRLGLERWHENCPCCFSEAYPEGLDEAVRKLKG